MGTHPIFESDFDCLTDMFRTIVRHKYRRPQYNQSAVMPDGNHPRAPYKEKIVRPKNYIEPPSCEFELDIEGYTTEGTNTENSMNSPYKLELASRCQGCGINFDYKNTQIISQYVSPFTGKLYDKSRTGLCHKKYDELNNAHRIATKLLLIGP